MKKAIIILVVIVTVTVFLPKGIMATPFYEGKTLVIAVGAGPGGGYDRMARIFAKFLPKYIPGKPNVIVQNMVGAGGIINANYLYNNAKPDGLTIGALQRGIIIGQLTEVEGIRFDVRKFAWLGSPTSESFIFGVRSDLPYKSIEDLRKANRVIYVGADSTATSDYQFPALLKEFLGLNIKFTFYPSGTESMLAMEKKEIDAKAGSYLALKRYIERGLLRPLLRNTVAEPETKALPAAPDLTNSKLGKTLFTMLAAADKMGRPYACPPGTPADKLAILRDAFAKALKDPELRKYAGSLDIRIN